MPGHSLHLRSSREAPALRPADADLAFIAARLGMSQRPTRAIVAAIRILVADEGFPAPRTPRFILGKRQHGPAAVHRAALWDRDSVEAWFGDDLPPAEAARQLAGEKLALRHTLHRRALALTGQAA